MAVTLLRTPAPPRPDRRGRPLRVDARGVLLVGLVLTAVALAVALVGLVVDPRVIGGAPAWLKPVKFGISILVYVATMRWIVGLIQGHARGLRVVAVILVVAFVGELAAIDLQVLRGTTSHFNEATAFDASVFYAMGGMISFAFGATAFAALVALRSPGLDVGAAAGIRWGFALALLGMLVAVFMLVNTHWHAGGGHTVGAPDGGPGLPLTDWSLDHGDLRIGHFLGLHGLQALPIAAWALARLTPLAAAVRARLLAVAAGGWAGLVALVIWQALRGQALLRPDPLTLLSAALLAGAVLGAGALVLRSGRAGAAAAARSTSTP